MGELSKAKTELLQFENLLNNQKQELLGLLASPEIQNIEPESFFAEQLPALPANSPGIGQNPALKMAQSDLGCQSGQAHQISRSWTPRLEFWGTTYLRGSGIGFDGTVNKSSGWNLNRYNYGAGFQLAFPILELPMSG
jgi:outer membrane protein